MSIRSTVTKTVTQRVVLEITAPASEGPPADYDWDYMVNPDGDVVVKVVDFGKAKKRKVKAR